MKRHTLRRALIVFLILVSLLFSVSCGKEGNNDTTTAIKAQTTASQENTEQPSAYFEEPDIPKDTLLHSSLYEVDLTPYVPAIPYESLALDRAYIDKLINDDVKSFLSAFGTVEEYPDPETKAKYDDTVNIIFKGYPHDESVELPDEVLASMTNENRGEGYDLTLGSNTFMRRYESEEHPEKNNPGFEDQIVGHKKGEKFTITVTFPDDYGNSAELRGLVVDFDITLNSISHILETEITDDLVRNNSDFESADDFYEEIEKYYIRKCSYDGIKDTVTINEYPDKQVSEEYILVEYLFKDLDLSMTQGEFEERLNEFYSVNQEDYYFYYGIVSCADFLQRMGKDSLIFFFEREIVMDELASRVEIIEK